MASSTVLKRNPYVIGVPIHDTSRFFGRRELFDFIRNNLADGARVILLSGQRRIGKTSVLLQIPRQVALPDFLFVNFDLQALTRSPLAEVLSELVERITGAAKLDPASLKAPAKEGMESDPNLFAGFLHSVLEALPGKKLVLLLDEFDVLSNGTGEASVGIFFPFLESILARQERVAVIPVVGRRLDEIPRLLSLFKGAPHAKIGLLDERSARELITEPVEGLLDYAPEAIQAIRDLTAGHPYFTQLLCHVIFQTARDEGAATVTREMVENSVREAIEAGEAGLTWFREGLPVPERVVFSAIAEAQEKSGHTYKGFPDLLERHGAVVTGQLRSADQVLREWGFVEGEPVRVVVDLVRRWLVLRHPVRRVIWELSSLIPAAQQLFEQATAARQSGEESKALLLLPLYDAALGLNPNHFQALFDAAEFLLQEREYGRAAELYRRAYRVDPRRAKDNLFEALLGQAREMLERGEFTAAVELLGVALEVAPERAEVRDQLAAAQVAARRSLAVKNPFFAGDGTPIDLFVGRTKEVEELMHAMLSGHSAAICGVLGMGKTSLLRYIADPNVRNAHGAGSARVVTAYMNCADLAPFTEQRFWQRVVRELGGTQVVREVTGAVVPTVDIYDLEDRLRGLSKEAAAVLLLDDFDARYEAPEKMRFLLNLRAILNKENIGIAAIVASRKPLMQLMQLRGSTEPGSPWYNIFRQIVLRPFGDRELRELALKMPQGLVPDAPDQAWPILPASELPRRKQELALDAAEQAWLSYISGGYPRLAQSALSILFRQKAAGERFDGNAASREMTSDVESFFPAVWDKVSEVERNALAFVSVLEFSRRVGNRPLDFNQWEEVPSTRVLFRGLESSGLLTTRRERVYTLTSPLMEWWIVRWIEGLSEEELLRVAEQISGMVFEAARNRVSDIVFEVWNRKLAEKEIEIWARPPEPGA